MPKRIGAFLIALVIGAGGVLALMFKARQQATEAERGKQAKETLDAVKDKVKLERKLDKPSARKRLRDKHYRD